ncbi:mechanosensitive ion channel [Flavobacteriales bacterium]|jgi:small-conductance mechanosensitive channel|nr:mechanosensitive ion channel [Crocinitomicaceae bacterium]MDA7742874.1 mechanosensitive ion channel [Flavobacteriales bacterium]
MKEILSSGFQLGEHQFTLGSMLQILAVLTVAQVVFWAVRAALRRIFKSSSMEEGTRFMIMRLLRTFIYTLGTIIALETAGVDLQALWFGSAALLVGVGIGLQNFFNDVVSGFVLLFEGGVRVGDELEVDGMLVRVERIDLRSTRVVTRFGNLIVMPNGLISGQTVRNFTQGDDASMLRVDVNAAYGSDLNTVQSILSEAAKSEKGVIRKDQVSVLFTDFGDSGLQFTVFFWVSEPWQRMLISSNVRLKINDAFRANGIVIPFPQRDLHLRTGDINPVQP